MSKDWQNNIQTLLNHTHIAFLSSQGEHSPETSMAPYAVCEGSIVLHLSGLARHSQNIQNHAQVGLMICTPESSESSPLALPRLSITGNIKAVSKAHQATCQQAYLDKIPDAEPLFSFPDFTLYTVQPETVFWVGGFGKARKIPLETWKSLC